MLDDLWITETALAALVGQLERDDLYAGRVAHSQHRKGDGSGVLQEAHTVVAHLSVSRCLGDRSLADLEPWGIQDTHGQPVAIDLTRLRDVQIEHDLSRRAGAELDRLRRPAERVGALGAHGGLGQCRRSLVGIWPRSRQGCREDEDLEGQFLPPFATTYTPSTADGSPTPSRLVNVGNEDTTLRVAVLIPALNEAESLPALFAEIPEVDRIVLIDNGSLDGTADIAANLGAEVIQQSKRGYGNAILSGMALLKVDPPDVVVILDADGADPPGLMSHLLEPIRENRADLVLSDRTDHAEPGSLTRTQRYGNRLATRLIAWQTGYRYRDMGPFRAIRWSSLERLQMCDPTWGWNVEMQMKAVQQGLRITEVPLPYRRRSHGESKISGNLSGALRAGYRILLAVNRYR